MREGEAHRRKPQAPPHDELDAGALTSAEKRRAEGREAEDGGSSSKRWCGAGARSEDGADLNGHEESKETRRTASEEVLVAGGGPQLDRPESEGMEDR